MNIGNVITTVDFEFDVDEIHAILKTAKTIKDLSDHMLSGEYSTVTCPLSDCEVENFTTDELDKLVYQLRLLVGAKALNK